MVLNCTFISVIVVSKDVFLFPPSGLDQGLHIWGLRFFV